MRDTRFKSIRDASEETGLSQYYLRTGCRSGNVPHIKSGTKYYVDVTALVSKLSSQSKSDGADRNEKD